MAKITLNNIGAGTAFQTAISSLNANNDAIEAAIENTLSRDGTTPNTMSSNLDMNSYRVYNLPEPLNGSEPLRLQDASTLNGGGTIATFPTGGTTGQVLGKQSGTDFDVDWVDSVTSVGLSLPADFTVTNSPVTSTGTLTGDWATPPTGTGAMVRATSPTLVTPALGTPSSGTLTNCTGLPVSTGVSGLGTGVATFLATPSSTNLASAVTGETGSGALVFATSPTLTTPNIGAASGTSLNLSGLTASSAVATDASKNLVSVTNTGSGNNVLATSPTLVTPILGTPTSGTLTNCTGLPVSTGVSGLGTGVATFLATPSSANLASAVTGETGSGALVFATSPTLVTPALGTPSSGTLTSCTGLPISTGVSGLGTGVATFLATPSSANLAAAVTGETGTGALVFATSPSLTTPNIGAATGTSLNTSGAISPGNLSNWYLYTSSSNPAVNWDANDYVLYDRTANEEQHTIGSTTRFKVKSTGIEVNGSAIFDGSTSGTTTLQSAATASGTLTLPAATDTLIGKATTDTLTNKTYDTAGTGNSFSINGLAATANTGTGAVVRATSPSLTTPALGTPSSGTLTNCTGLPTAGLVNNAVTLAKMQQVSTGTFLGRTTAGTGDVESLTATQATALLNLATTSVKGLAPVLPNDSTKYLDGTGNYSVPAGSGTGFLETIKPQGRLTLTSATPILTSTVSGATTVYYTPYVGNVVPLYDGTNMNPTAVSEISVATSDTSKNPAAIGASKVNDWFVWDDAGTIRLSHGPDWTNDTTRSAGTALTMVDGIYLNSVAITNGPGASRGTYVGTTRSNASSQIDWIFGAVAAGGTAGAFYLWNAYNRETFATMVGDSTDSWTYATAAWRQANNQANMKVAFVRGLDIGRVRADYNALGQGSASGGAGVAIGLDSTTAKTGAVAISAASQFGAIIGQYVGLPGIGLHTVYPIEYSRGAGTVTFYGDIADGTTYQSGLLVEFEA